MTSRLNPFAPIALVMLAPLVGIDREHLAVLHRVDLAGTLIRPRPVAACGTAVTYLGHDGAPVRWADIRTRGTRLRRCKDCKTTNTKDGR